MVVVVVLINYVEVLMSLCQVYLNCDSTLLVMVQPLPGDINIECVFHCT